MGIVVKHYIIIKPNVMEMHFSVIEMLLQQRNAFDVVLLVLDQIGYLPELYLVLGDLTVPGMLWRRVVHDLHHIRGLEPP